jgi:hypothetical protein
LSTKIAVLLAVAVVTTAALSSCNRQPVEWRQATVLLQDGSQVNGAVVSSSDAEITLAGQDNITRTIPMNQVKSVQYGEVAPPPEVATGTPPPASAPAPAPPAPPAPAREANVESSQPVAKQSVAPPRRPASLARTFELPVGTEFPVRTNELIDSANASEGQSFDAEVSSNVLNSAGTVVIPKGSQARIVILSASKGGKIRGASDLIVSLSSVTVGGQRHQLDTSDVAQRGKDGFGANKRTATYTGGGAAVGAIIGAIAGGGKGAAIGAGAGAGGGALTQILTKGKSIRIPAESSLTFRLEAPLRVTAE